MDHIRPIRWKEGMFLRPHHMQHLELFLEAREAARLTAAESQGWGFLELDIQDEALKNFTMDVRSLRALMPDGALIDVPGNARLPSRSFEIFAKEAGRPLNVFLGVRAREDRRPQVALEGDGRTRYAVREIEVHDTDVGQDPASLEFLEYDLRLFFGDEPQQGYDVLPLARLVRSGDAAKPMRFVDDFAPPCIWLGASPVLRGAVRDVVEQMANALRIKGAEAKGSGHADRLLLYQTMASSLPVLRYMTKDERVHPKFAYLELARLAGGLSFHSPVASLDDIPVYEHRDPAASLLALRSLIGQWSADLVVPNYTRVATQRAGDEFRCALPSDFKKLGTQAFVEVAAEESTPRIKVLMVAAKISTSGRITKLRELAIPGVPNDPMTGPPAELPPGQKSSFFRLDVTHGEWGSHVVPSADLTVFLLGAPQDVRVQIVLVFPRS